MKKRLISFLIALTVCLSFLTFTGCNTIDAGKLDSIAGTYHLTVYENEYRYDKDFNEYPSGERPVDNFIELNGIDLYVVVSTTGRGYYVYKDNTMQDYECLQVVQTYERNADNQSLINKVMINCNDIAKDDFRWSNGILELCVQSKKSTLTDNGVVAFKTNSCGGYHGQRYSQYVKYEKVNKSQTLSYVENVLGKTLSYVEYELVGLNGVWSMYEDFGNDEYRNAYSDYIYNYYEIDAKTKTAKHCYATTADRVKMEEDNLAVTYTVVGSSATVTIGTEVFKYDANEWYQEKSKIVDVVGEINYYLRASRYYGIFLMDDISYSFDGEIQDYVNGLE